MQGPEPTFSRSLRDAGLGEQAAASLAGLSSRLLAIGVGENALSALASRAALTPGAGWSTDDVRRAAEAAADDLAGQRPPHAPVEIEDHRAAGRRLVLVSAHPEPLVSPLAARW